MTAPALQADTEAPPEWSLARRTGFRFLFAYWLLYLLPFPLGMLPWTESLSKGFAHGVRKAVPWLAAHVLRMKTPVAWHTTGSGDTLFDWVNLLLSAILAAVVAIVWSLASRRREHRKLDSVLRVYVRYGLAAIMLGYGLVKVFPVQFSPNDPARLMEPYGQLSPMGVVWAMMGSSSAYTIASGIGETLGGLLLFFRRTTTLGALLLLAVVGNVVLLNFCYDVPVKQFSAHLWLMALFLAWPDLRMLFDVLVRRRRIEPAQVSWRLASRRWHIAARVAKYAFVGWLVFSNVREGLDEYRQYGPGRGMSPWEGVWDVEDRSGGAPHWQRVGLSHFRAAVATDTELYRPYSLEFDDKTGTLQLQSREDKRSFAVHQIDADHLILDGPFVLTLRRVDPSKITLTSRGFHWISEYPFNR